MSDSEIYSILSAGGVVDGHDPAKVVAEFCKLFDIDADKARVYIETQKHIKKGLTQSQAIAYREHFKRIGVPVTVKKHKPVKTGNVSDVSLTPAKDATPEQPSSDNEAATTAVVGTAAIAGGVPNGASVAKQSKATIVQPKEFSCPKCEKVQVRSGTCLSCGIVFEKYEVALARVKDLNEKLQRQTRHSEQP